MIGKKLKELIKVRNIKQIKLAKYVGISPSRLSNYLSDKREPDLEMLAKMAKYLNVDLNYFTDVRFPVKKDTSYVTTFEDDSLLAESAAVIESDVSLDDVLEVPFLSINSKKRALKNKTLPIPKILLEDIDNPEENAILFEVTTGIGGDTFRQGDYIMAARFSSISAKNGSLVFESGRNGKVYRFFDDGNIKLLLTEDTKDIHNIPDEAELSKYYVIVWVIKKP